MSRTIICGDIHGSYKALLQCLERSKFDYENDTLIQLGDIVDGWNQVYECVEELLKITNLICIRGNHDCLDEETEVFTDYGWKKYTELSYSHKVLGINHNNNLSEWQNINDIIIKDSNHINYYSNNRIDMALTDNHRILYKENNEYKYTTIKNVKFNDRIKIPLANYRTNIDNNYYLDNEIKLVAWILTDGNIEKKNGYITIYQSKKENIDYIENLLKSLNIKFTYNIRKRNTKFILGKKIKSINLAHEFKINSEFSKKIRNYLIKSKYTIPEWCYNLSQRQSELFLNEIIRGDGSNYLNSDNSILYGTESFLNQIQPIFNISGYSANLKKSNRGDFRLNISKKIICSIRQDISKIKRIEGKFKVWCLSVPFTNFLVRRNGKSYFTGNCWFCEFLKFGIHPMSWQQGGFGTLQSYCINLNKSYIIQDDYYKTDLNVGDIPESHKALFRNQAHFYKDENNNLFIHGGFFRNVLLKDHISFDEFWWNRDLWLAALSFNTINDKTINFKIKEKTNEIFIGHTTTINWGKDTPMKAANIWNLDTGAGFKGKLTFMDLETKKYWQSDEVSELYKDQKGRN